MTKQQPDIQSRRGSTVGSWSTPRMKSGVIDIGSNSVRLVVYDVEMGVPLQIFNEKVLSALGKGVSKTERLNPDGWDSACNAIRRFCAIAQEMQVSHLIAVATAAVRDAKDGPAFVKEVEASCDIEIRVLSGEEEAYYSALGVAAGIHQADGIVGDLGGGSLELADLEGVTPGDGVTLPFGPLRLIDQFGDNLEEAQKNIETQLHSVDWLTVGKGRTFYAVGGAWRALAQVHIDEAEYPLNILHNYEIDFDDALSLCQEVAASSQEDLTNLGTSVSNRRLSTLPHAAMVLGCLLRIIEPRNIVVSGFGLREGLALEQSFGKERAPDLLLAMCQELARSKGRFGDHGDEIEEWIAPLFHDETDEQKRLHHMTCLLSDIGWAGHPDYRAQVVFQDVLHSQLVGVDHAGRTFIALALYVSYRGKVGKSVLANIAPLLGDEAIKQAEILGLALRLAQRLSGGTEGILGKCELSQSKDKVILHVPDDYSHLVSEVVERRLRNLALSIGKEYTIKA